MAADEDRARIRQEYIAFVQAQIAAQRSLSCEEFLHAVTGTRDRDTQIRRTVALHSVFRSAEILSSFLDIEVLPADGMAINVAKDTILVVMALKAQWGL
jgi:hypothetical protein